MSLLPHVDRGAERLALQARLDAAKTQAARNKLGQFATPAALAREVVAHALTLLPEREPLRFLDPAFGTGSFYDALLATAGSERVSQALGFEIDPHYGTAAQALWQGTPLQLTLADFTRQTPPVEGVNLLMANPPYVRHHHLDAETKGRLQARSAQAAGITLSGLAGLYAHFMAIAHPWMAPGGLACWLIPSEFMDVNYGRELKRYLCERVTLLRIHRYDPEEAQFDDALVSSAVVWFRNTAPTADQEVMFTYGGSHSAPQVTRGVPLRELARAPKWTRFPVSDVQGPHAHDVPRLSELFDVRRGIATGDNAFFILTPERMAALDLPLAVMTPILPSPRHLEVDVIEADERGHPLLARPQFLLDCRLPEAELRRRHPTVWAYLESGREALLQRYICAHRPLWYVQERCAPAPLLCTYMGRSGSRGGKPFRFVLNRSRAVVANTYLNLYPKPHVAQRLAERPDLLDAVWHALNALDPAQMVAQGRVYGGGLHKMEPKELAQVPVGALAEALGWPAWRGAAQAELINA